MVVFKMGMKAMVFANIKKGGERFGLTVVPGCSLSLQFCLKMTFIE